MEKRKKITAVLAVLLAAALLGGTVSSCGFPNALGADNPQTVLPGGGSAGVSTQKENVVTGGEPADTGSEEPNPDTAGQEELDPGDEDAPKPVEGGPYAPAVASAHLAGLGIMRGVGEKPDHTVDLALDATLSRQEAVTFIVRIMGYDCPGPDANFSHPFTDVASWASGSVGYAYCHGIALGTGENSFSSADSVTGRELVTFSLRALGYRDTTLETACALSDDLGLTDGQLGDGTAPLTRGEAAVVLERLLITPRKDSGRTFLAELVETGFVTLEQAVGQGFEDALQGINSGAVPASAVAAGYRDTVVTVETTDLMMRALTSAHGSIVADGVVAVPLEALKGASYAKVTDINGKEIGYSGVLSYDVEAGIAYLSCDVKLPETARDSAAAAGDVQYPLYVVSDAAFLCRSEADAAHFPALRAVSLTGESLGIAALRGVIRPEMTAGEAMDLYDLGQLLWKDLCPAFRPRGIDPSKPMTAITYDDGPSAQHTPELLDLLKQYGAVATFFEVGQNVKAHPEFLTRMEAQNCEIGNHSWSHRNLKKLSDEEIIEQIQMTNDIIKQYVGHDVALVRCPGGNHNDRVDSLVGHPMIYWTIDTRDWESRNAEKVIAHVKNDKKSLDGVIILMHSLYASTVEASTTIIPWIIEQGYQTVTVSELAYFRGVQLQNGETYISFPKR